MIEYKYFNKRVNPEDLHNQLYQIDSGLIGVSCTVDTITTVSFDKELTKENKAKVDKLLQDYIYIVPAPVDWQTELKGCKTAKEALEILAKRMGLLGKDETFHFKGGKND